MVLKMISHVSYCPLQNKMKSKSLLLDVKGSISDVSNMLDSSHAIASLQVENTKIPILRGRQQA